MRPTYRQWGEEDRKAIELLREMCEFALDPTKRHQWHAKFRRYVSMDVISAAERAIEHMKPFTDYETFRKP
jgi:hypothetical protein